MRDVADVDLPVARQSIGFSGIYMLVVLCGIGVFNQLDRQIISIVLQPIKLEFHASDTAMGLLTGSIYAGFYAAAGIPLGRLLDRYPRKYILAGCVVFWSLMTSLGGFSRSYLQLALTRVGVATGEAGAAPAAVSLIADIFKVNLRAFILAVYANAQCLGLGLGIMLGGWLSQNFGWRTSFMVVGVPGLLLGLVLLLTVREPSRGHSDGLHAAPAPMSTKQALRALLGIRTYRWILITVGLSSFMGWALLSWAPTFLLRIHHLPISKVGLWLGLTIAGSFIVGNFLSGFLADLFGKRDIRGYLWVAGAGPALSIIPCLIFAFAPDWRVAMVALFFCQALLTFHIPGCGAMAMTLVPIRARATAAVLSGLAATVVGSGLAPLVIGGMNDALNGRFGTESLRYSLSIVCVAAAAAAVAAINGARSAKHDYANRASLTEVAAGSTT